MTSVGTRSRTLVKGEIEMGNDPQWHSDDQQVGPYHPEDTTGATVTIDDHGHVRQVTAGDLTDPDQQLKWEPQDPAHQDPGWMPHVDPGPDGGTPAQRQAWQDGHHAAFQHQIGQCLADPDLDQWYQAGYAAGGGVAAADPAAGAGDAYAVAGDAGSGDGQGDGSGDSAWG